jgi:hypothetical protein
VALKGLWEDRTPVSKCMSEGRQYMNLVAVLLSINDLGSNTLQCDWRLVCAQNVSFGGGGGANREVAYHLYTYK